MGKSEASFSARLLQLRILVCRTQEVQAKQQRVDGKPYAKETTADVLAKLSWSIKVGTKWTRFGGLRADGGAPAAWGFFGIVQGWVLRVKTGVVLRKL